MPVPITKTKPTPKSHRVVHPAWAQCLAVNDAVAALRVAENEGWPPASRFTRPARQGASDPAAPDPRATRSSPH